MFKNYSPNTLTIISKMIKSGREVLDEYNPPDRPVEITFDCYPTGGDPCLGFILATPSGSINGVCHCDTDGPGIPDSDFFD